MTLERQPKPDEAAVDAVVLLTDRPSATRPARPNATVAAALLPGAVRNATPAILAGRPIGLLALALALLFLLAGAALLLGRGLVNRGRPEDHAERTAEGGQGATAGTGSGLENA